MPDIEVPTDEQVIARFAGMSRVNQLAAGLNPDDWAEVQTRAVPDQREEFVRRANIWRTYMLELADDTWRRTNELESAPMDSDTTYKIRRFCFNDNHPDHHRIIATGLTLDEAQAHCDDESTHGEDDERGPWFDGYDEE